MGVLALLRTTTSFLPLRAMLNEQIKALGQLCEHMGKMISVDAPSPIWLTPPPLPGPFSNETEAATKDNRLYQIDGC